MQLESIPCPWCYSPKREPFLRDEFRDLWVCHDCNLVYLSPRPASTSELYDKTYYLEKNIVGEGAYWSRIADIESRVTKRGSLVEIGCGTGVFCRVMANRGWDVLGLDVSSYSIESAKKYEQSNLRFCHIDPASDQHFSADVICAYQVLEHVPSPRDMLVNLRKKLVPGGLLVLEVPNIDAFDFKFNKLQRKRSLDVPYHLCHFRPEWLRWALATSGFEVLDTDYYIPNAVISAVDFRERVRSWGHRSADSNVSSKLSDAAPPLAQRLVSLGSRLLKAVGEMLPGWRFTVFARKT